MHSISCPKVPLSPLLFEVLLHAWSAGAVPGAELDVPPRPASHWLPETALLGMWPVEYYFHYIPPEC